MKILRTFLKILWNLASLIIVITTMSCFLQWQDLKAVTRKVKLSTRKCGDLQATNSPGSWVWGGPPERSLVLLTPAGHPPSPPLPCMNRSGGKGDAGHPKGPRADSGWEPRTPGPGSWSAHQRGDVSGPRLSRLPIRRKGPNSLNCDV